MLTVLPLILLLAFWLGDDDDSGGRGFVDLAQESGANLVVFTLFASTSFLLVVIVALFAGDTVPSEASWSTLRYLLAAPVRRERLLRQKLQSSPGCRRWSPRLPFRPGRWWSAGSRTAGARWSGRPATSSTGRPSAGDC